MAGRILRICRETDLVVDYQYDDVDRLTGEVWWQRSDGSQVYGFCYDYDGAHNRVKMRREAAGVETESAYYGYDAANALTQRAVYTPGTAGSCSSDTGKDGGDGASAHPGGHRGGRVLGHSGSRTLHEGPPASL